MCSIGSHDIGKRPPILVLAVALDGDVFGIDERGRRMSRAVAERLAFFRAINAAEANPFFFPIAEDVDSVSIEDADHFACGGEGICTAEETEPSQESHKPHRLWTAE